jgi:hypothetical protein
VGFEFYVQKQLNVKQTLSSPSRCSLYAASTLSNPFTTWPIPDWRSGGNMFSGTNRREVSPKAATFLSCSLYFERRHNSQRKEVNCQAFPSKPPSQFCFASSPNQRQACTGVQVDELDTDTCSLLQTISLSQIHFRQDSSMDQHVLAQTTPC